MANSDKNIIITPNRSLSGQPEVSFTGFGNSSISLKVPDSTTATLNFESSGTNLLSVDSNLSSGGLFNVSNPTALPSVSVDNTKINLGSQGGKVIINGKGLKIPKFASNNFPPSREGTVIYDSTNGVARCFNGTRWAILGGKKSGLSMDNPGESAEQILMDYPNSPDGAYWIQPSGSPEPFLVHCYMTIEGGGWMLVLKNSSSELGAFGSGTFLVSNWEGWAYYTKDQIDGLGFDNSTNADQNAFSPVYAYSPFTDVMVIANRDGQQSKRVGWRHASGFARMYDAIITPSEKVATSVLFRDPYRWLQQLDVRSDTNAMGATGTVKVGFKIRSDTGSSIATSNWTGGFHTSAMHYGSQIGCGRDNQNPGEWGGGFGGAYTTGPRYHRLNGHWWNHGDARSQAIWNAQNDFSSGLFGHAVYVR